MSYLVVTNCRNKEPAYQVFNDLEDAKDCATQQLMPPINGIVAIYELKFKGEISTKISFEPPMVVSDDR